MESNAMECVYFSVILFVGSIDIATSWTQETSTGAGTSSMGFNSTHTVINSTTAIINPTASPLEDNTTAVISSTANIVQDETTATINSSIITVTNSTPATIEYTSQSNSASPTSHGSTQPISGSDIVVCQVYDRNSLMSLHENCTLVNFTFGECYCLVAEYCCHSLDNCCPDKCTCIEKSTSITLDEDLIITISVAGFLLLMICTFVIVYFVRHATSKKYQKQLKPTISASSNNSGVAAASVAAAPTSATLTSGRATTGVRAAATTVTPSARMNSHRGQNWRDNSPPRILTRNPYPYRHQQDQRMLL